MIGMESTNSSLPLACLSQIGVQRIQIQHLKYQIQIRYPSTSPTPPTFHPTRFPYHIPTSSSTSSTSPPFLSTHSSSHISLAPPPIPLPLLPPSSAII